MFLFFHVGILAQPHIQNKPYVTLHQNNQKSKHWAHNIGSFGINKVSLSCFDNRRYILEDGKMGNAIMRIRDALLGMCITQYKGWVCHTDTTQMSMNTIGRTTQCTKYHSPFVKICHNDNTRNYDMTPRYDNADDTQIWQWQETQLWQCWLSYSLLIQQFSSKTKPQWPNEGAA
jgi:hypothetical protein